jgi:hypothetical protein
MSGVSIRTAKIFSAAENAQISTIIWLESDCFSHKGFTSCNNETVDVAEESFHDWRCEHE